MFWHLLPAPAIGGQVRRGAPISTDEWEEKTIRFDEKTGRAWPQVAQMRWRGKGCKRICADIIMGVPDQGSVRFDQCNPDES